MTLHMQSNSYSESLSVDDQMEVTSEIDRGSETVEDIDIDLDLAGENQGVDEDEYMLEDEINLTKKGDIGEQDPRGSMDDEMADDAYLEGVKPERSLTYDEDLEDADSVEQDLDEDTVAEPPVQDPSESYSEVLDREKLNESHEPNDEEYHTLDINANEEQDQEIYQQPDSFNNDLSVETELVGDEQEYMLNHGQNATLPKVQGNSDQNQEDDLHGPSVSSADGHYEHTEITSEVSHVRRQDPVEENESLSSNRSTDVNTFAQGELVNSVGPILEEMVNYSSPSVIKGFKSSETSNVIEADGSKESNPLHPVIVMYQDNEISLFPLITNEEEHSSTYFLQDEEVASQSITKLLGACRLVLADNVSAEEELMIHFEELGLQISEVTLNPCFCQNRLLTPHSSLPSHLQSH